MHSTDGSDQPHAPLPGAAPPKTSSPWLAMIPLMIPIVMVNVDITAVNLAMAHIARDLHVSLSVVQWVVNGYMMTAGAFLILGSRLGDAGKKAGSGRRRVVVHRRIRSRGRFNVGWALIASRMFQGGWILDHAPIPLSGPRYFSRKQEKPGHGRDSGRDRAVHFRRPDGGRLYHSYLQLAQGVLDKLAAGIVDSGLRLSVPARNPRPARDKVRSRGQTLLALSLFALTAGLNAVAGRQGGPFSMAGLSGAGLLFFILFIFHEKRASEPLMDPELMNNRHSFGRMAPGWPCNSAIWGFCS